MRWVYALGVVGIAGMLVAGRGGAGSSGRRNGESRDATTTRSQPSRGSRLSSPSVPTNESITPAAAALSRRIEQVSATYLGTPYGRDPLGEGPGARPDPDPLFRRDRVDCVTFVEQVLAEALAQQPGDFLPLLTRLRYHGGAVGFGTRNHYMVSDWLPHNRWCIADVTESVNKGGTRRMIKVINRRAFFEGRRAPALAAAAREERSVTSYLPRTSVPAALGRLPDVALLIWVQDRPGIIAAHCGFAIRRSGGGLVFRHASERQGRVVDEPLMEYCQRSPRRIVGVKVCMPVPPLDTARRPR